MITVLPVADIGQPFEQKIIVSERVPLWEVYSGVLTINIITHMIGVFTGKAQSPINGRGRFSGRVSHAKDSPAPTIQS